MNRTVKIAGVFAAIAIIVAIVLSRLQSDPVVNQSSESPAVSVIEVTTTPVSASPTAPTSTPIPTTAPTSTPIPTTAPTSTSIPTTAPTSTSIPTATSTLTPAPTVAPTNEPELSRQYIETTVKESLVYFDTGEYLEIVKFRGYNTATFPCGGSVATVGTDGDDNPTIALRLGADGSYIENSEGVLLDQNTGKRYGLKFLPNTGLQKFECDGAVKITFIDVVK